MKMRITVAQMKIFHSCSNGTLLRGIFLWCAHNILGPVSVIYSKPYKQM